MSRQNEKDSHGLAFVGNQQPTCLFVSLADQKQCQVHRYREQQEQQQQQTAPLSTTTTLTTTTAKTAFCRCQKLLSGKLTTFEKNSFLAQRSLTAC